MRPDRPGNRRPQGGAPKRAVAGGGGHVARKRFGQHFLSDSGVIDEIVRNDVGLSFGPDTLAEARNRGYSLATPGRTRRHRKPRA